ncbi:hypothetical protein L596_011096 [Steinernema carpocapsae]|uniref:MIT domain-containing protein n=1 Tax=Steinernema carpocapsae TaxID=34508 RepID=A0A4U5NSH8_STECR|nr:hypothetical protein L596_011096 [Steinernema carpocapsae]
MSVLLKDECECSSEFCGMLYRREKNEWRFSVVVSDVIESRTTLGHTDYRLVVTAVPKNGLELDTRQFSLLTRFKELNKLWSQLGKIHQQLYLHGTFPDFAPARFFKKTEPDTIIERVEGAKRFLNFIFDSDVLCKSRALQQFFEAAEEIAMTHDLTEPIAVTNVAEQSETAQDPSAVTSETPPSDSLDEVSLHSPPLTSAGNNTDDEEIEFEFNNVPINPFDAEREAGSPSFFGRMFPMFSSRAQHQTPRYSIQNRGAITAESIRPHSRTSSVSSVGVGNGTLAPNSGAVRTHDEEIDYLVQAGHFIGTAQRAETEKAYELAFHCYKNAVNILLQGVQFENDLSRRNAVRKKTVKYLMKAERLGRLYLSFDGTAFDMDSWLNISLQDPSLIAFQASNSALKTYKITDALPSFSAYKRVLLVEDPEGEKYALKLLEKSYTSALKSLEKPTAIKMNIAPVGVSNMVQMHKFFETDDFTILSWSTSKEASYGHSCKYFESRVEEFEAERESQSPLPIYRSDPNDAPTTSTALPSEAPETNVYSGSKSDDASRDQGCAHSKLFSKLETPNNKSCTVVNLQNSVFKLIHTTFSLFGRENEQFWARWSGTDSSLPARHIPLVWFHRGYCFVSCASSWRSSLFKNSPNLYGVRLVVK